MGKGKEGGRDPGSATLLSTNLDMQNKKFDVLVDSIRWRPETSDRYRLKAGAGIRPGTGANLGLPIPKSFPPIPSSQVVVHIVPLHHV